MPELAPDNLDAIDKFRHFVLITGASAATLLQIAKCIYDMEPAAVSSCNERILSIIGATAATYLATVTGEWLASRDWIN